MGADRGELGDDGLDIDWFIDVRPGRLAVRHHERAAVAPEERWNGARLAASGVGWGCTRNVHRGTRCPGVAGREELRCGRSEHGLRLGAGGQRRVCGSSTSARPVRRRPCRRRGRASREHLCGVVTLGPSNRRLAGPTASRRRLGTPLRNGSRSSPSGGRQPIRQSPAARIGPATPALTVGASRPGGRRATSLECQVDRSSNVRQAAGGRSPRRGSSG